jgi:hypothetical protein
MSLDMQTKLAIYRHFAHRTDRHTGLEPYGQPGILARHAS